MTFKHNEIVGIKEFKDCEYNCHGRVNSNRFNKILGETVWHVSNMNMPFQGTISEWFTFEELYKL